LFLEILENFSGLKSQLSNCNLLVLKSRSLNMKNQEDCGVSWLRTSLLCRYKIVASEIDLKSFRNFLETGPRDIAVSLLLLNYKYY